jgi:putative Holliday junction resolvase
MGLAVSDAEGSFAFPAGALERRGTLTRDMEALRQLVAERGITQIVVGLPIHMNGREGPEAHTVREFAKALSSATGLPVELMDERWTTREAERTLRDAPGRRRRQRGEVDALAATLLLRAWLERERSGAAPGTP